MQASVRAPVPAQYGIRRRRAARSFSVPAAALLFFFAAGAASAAESWRQAYADWLNTCEAAGEILKWANFTDEVAGREVSDSLYNLTMGNMEQRAYAVLEAPEPADICGDYAIAILDVASVAGVVFDEDTADPFLHKVIGIFRRCPGQMGEEIPFPGIPAGSRWLVTFEDSIDYSGCDCPHYEHMRERFEGEIALPEIPLLTEFLNRSAWVELRKEMGDQAAYDMARMDFLSGLMMWTEKAAARGTVTNWRDALPVRVLTEDSRWKTTVRSTGCPAVTVNAVYRVYASFDLDSPGAPALTVGTELASFTGAPPAQVISTFVDTDKKDGHTSTKEQKSVFSYDPQPGFDDMSSHPLPFREGVYAIESRNDQSEVRRKTVTLKCLDPGEKL